MAKIEVELSEYRPCIVDMKKALFHKWDVKEEIFVKFNNLVRGDRMKEAKDYIENNLIIPQGNDVVKVSNTYALVEFEDGTVKHVEPEAVVFLDSGNKFNERCF